MTSDEQIAEAREFLATPNLGKSMAREPNLAILYIRELADALEVAMVPHAECEASGERAGAQLADLKAALEAAEARVKELEAGIERLQMQIEEARTAWWSATEQGDSGLVYTDRIEDAMDDIWSAIGGSDWVPVESEGE